MRLALLNSGTVIRPPVSNHGLIKIYCSSNLKVPGGLKPRVARTILQLTACRGTLNKSHADSHGEKKTKDVSLGGRCQQAPS